MELQHINSLDATAEYLGMSPTVLRRLARDHKIGFLRTGRAYTFPREVIREYVEGHTVKQAATNPWGLTDRSLQNVRRSRTSGK